VGITPLAGDACSHPLETLETVKGKPEMDPFNTIF
jgi:hypothetical protein